jgi:hypothetical protein
MKAIFAATATVVALVAMAGRAHAEPTNTLATSAFREGRDALKAGDYALACARFAESDAAEPSSGARLNLGDCALRDHRYLRAEQLYKGAALLAEGDKRAFASQRAAAAHALTGTLRLRWARPTPAGARAELDGHAVEVPADVPVDPGRHTIAIVFPLPAAQPALVEVASGDTATLELVAGNREPRSAPDHADSSSRRSRSPLAYVLLGVGAAALVGGGVSGLVAKAARDDVSDACGAATPCPVVVWARDDVQRDYDRARTWALVSTISFIGGAVALVAGGTLWLATAPSPNAQTVMLGGSF